MPNIRHKICKQCKSSFSYPIRMGGDKVFCSDKCCNKAGIESFKRRHEGKTCSISACSNKVKNIGRMICAKHETRMIRTGDYTRRKPTVRTTRTNGYVVVKMPEHPLCQSSGWIFEHRMVAYTKYGAGQQECHWCGIRMPWDQMVVDHMNNVKSDNRPDNLVVTCNTCNRSRGLLIGFVSAMLPHRFEGLVDTLRVMREPADG